MNSVLRQSITKNSPIIDVLSQTEVDALQTQIADSFSIDIFHLNVNFWENFYSYKIKDTDKKIQNLRQFFPQTKNVYLLDIAEPYFILSIDPANLEELIGECPYFEYLIYDPEQNRIIFENDHDELFLITPSSKTNTM